jgi:hypothetical protein
MFCAVSALEVQRQLSAELGRPAEVFMLGWFWPGFDVDYVVGADLLDHRRVRMLVIYDENRSTDTPHVQSARWFRCGEHEEVLDGLSRAGRAGLYGGEVLGAPRQLLSILRPDRLADPTHCVPSALALSTQYHSLDIAEQRGSLAIQQGFNGLPNFTPFAPPLMAQPEDTVVYSAATRGAFRFTGPPTSPYQRHFVQLLAQKCRARGTRLVMLHVPKFAERDDKTIAERVIWPEELGVPVDIVGIPGTKLFAGVPPDGLEKLFVNSGHFNQNGQRWFTSVITPTLLKLYAASTNQF